jgi:transcriptional regulator with XRE-family HTH domain
MVFLYSAGNMLSLIGISPSDIQAQLSADMKYARLYIKGWKRTTLAEKSGVPVSTIKRFENTSAISLKQLLMLAHALGMLTRFEQLLHMDVEGMSMQDYIKQQVHKKRLRGSK